MGSSGQFQRRLSGGVDIGLISVLSASSLIIFGVLSSSLVISDLGIISSFPVIFWIGLAVGIIGYSATVRVPSRKGQTLYLYSLLLVSFWLVPLLLGARQPYSTHIWAKTGSLTATIISTGHIDAFRVWYHNWPGAWIILATLQLVLGFDGLPGEIVLSAYGPALIQVGISIALFAIARHFWRERPELARLSLLVLLQSNWSLQNYVSPQAFGLLLLLLVLLVVARSTRHVVSTPHVVVCLLGLAAIAITHPITSVFALASLTCGFAALAAGNQAPYVRRHWIFTGMLPAAVVLAIAWNGWGAWPWVAGNLASMIRLFWGLKGLDSFIQRVAGSQGPHELIVRSRILYSVLWLGLGLAGVVVLLLDAVSRNQAIVRLMVGVSIGLLLAILVPTGPESESIDRSLFLLVVPTSLFVPRLWMQRTFSAVLTATLVLSSPLFFIAHYGDQRADFFQASFVESVRFFQTHVNRGTVTERRLGESPYGDISGPGSFRGVTFGEMRDQILAGAVLVSKPHYVPVSSRDQEADYFMAARGNPVSFVLSWLEDSQGYGRIYDSQRVRIYLDEG